MHRRRRPNTSTRKLTTAAALGAKGGKARAANLSPQARSEAARYAALARWKPAER